MSSEALGLGMPLCEAQPGQVRGWDEQGERYRPDGHSPMVVLITSSSGLSVRGWCVLEVHDRPRPVWMTRRPTANPQSDGTGYALCG